MLLLTWQCMSLCSMFLNRFLVLVFAIFMLIFRVFMLQQHARGCGNTPCSSHNATNRLYSISVALRAARGGTSHQFRFFQPAASTAKYADWLAPIYTATWCFDPATYSQRAASSTLRFYVLSSSPSLASSLLIQCKGGRHLGCLLLDGDNLGCFLGLVSLQHGNRFSHLQHTATPVSLWSHTKVQVDKPMVTHKGMITIKVQKAKC